jgi:hypothetical protein
MIQQNHHSIYLLLPNGEKLPLLAHSVAINLCQENTADGGMESWQIEEMAEALIYHLRVDLKRDTIPLEEFAAALSKLTAICGGNDAALQASIVPATDLYELAQATGGGFELGFFQSVERAIQEFRQRNTRLVRFVRLHSCVKLLVGAKNWGKSCQRVNDDIVSFIRSRMLQDAEKAPVVFAVSQ